MSKVIKIAADKYVEEVEQHQGKVLVDFYAEWCGPCKMIAPLLDQLSEEADDLKIVKVDADEAPELMAKFGIRGIPTLLLVEDGEVKGTKVGALPASELKKFVA